MSARGWKSITGSAFSTAADPVPIVERFTTGFGVADDVVVSISMADGSLGFAETAPDRAAMRSVDGSVPRIARTSGASTTRDLKSFRGSETDPAMTA